MNLYLSGSKIGIYAVIWEGLCAWGVYEEGGGGGGGGYRRSNISVEENVALSAGKPTRGGGELIGGEIRYVKKNYKSICSS